MCFEPLTEATCRVLRVCRHAMCEECLNRVNPKVCPLCRAAFTTVDVLSKEQLTTAAGDDGADEGAAGAGSSADDFKTPAHTAATKAVEDSEDDSAASDANDDSESDE